MIAVNVRNEDPVGLRILTQIRDGVRIDMDYFSAELKHNRAMNNGCDLEITLRRLFRRYLRRQQQKRNKNRC